MSKSKKLTWLLILQAWTMLWVIIGHAPLDKPSSEGVDMIMHTIAHALFSFAYSFHMPLFIMISGYLFYRTRIVKGWKYPDMIKEKWLRLGIPYLFFISIGIIVKLCFSSGVNRSLDTSPMGFVMNYIDPFNGALQEMWFVAVIFLYFILYPIYSFLLKNVLTTIITIGIGFLLFFIPLNSIPSVFAINRAIHFFIFFFIGLCISRWSLENKIDHWSTIGICIGGYILSYYLKVSIIPAIFASIGFWGIAMKIDRTLTSNLIYSIHFETIHIRYFSSEYSHRYL